MAGFFVFAHILMVDYFRLGWIRFNICSAGLENWSPAGARYMRRATVEMRKNATSDSSLDPNFSILIPNTNRYYDSIVKFV